MKRMLVCRMIHLIKLTQKAEYVASFKVPSSKYIYVIQSFCVEEKFLNDTVEHG